MDENEEQEDMLYENVEQQNEAQEDYVEDNSPTYTKPEDLYSLFWKVIETKDSSKVGNLDKNELGLLDISVRDCQYIANVASMLGHKGFSKWMNAQAQITLKTSASKKGWLTELFVTSKRYASKERKNTFAEPTSEPKKTSFWNRK